MFGNSDNEQKRRAALRKKELKKQKKLHKIHVQKEQERKAKLEETKEKNRAEGRKLAEDMINQIMGEQSEEATKTRLARPAYLGGNNLNANGIGSTQRQTTPLPPGASIPGLEQNGNSQHHHHGPPIKAEPPSGSGGGYNSAAQGGASKLPRPF